MSTHQIGAPGVSISGTVTVPDMQRWPAHYLETFDNGIGHWTAPGPIGGPRDVVNGVFRSWNWSYDSNHLTSVGGPGMLHLLAYADHHYFNRTTATGDVISSDFTNARIKMLVRGVGFAPNGSEWIIWITANHPTALGKNVNWGFVANPITTHLLSGNWTEVEVLIDPNPAKWVWGKGANGSIYDTFLSLPESLRNIYNLHMPTLGPDNVNHPSGQFELDTFEIAFNKNGPDSDPVSVPPQDGWTVAFNPLLNTLSTPNANYAIRGISLPFTVGGSKLRATVFAPPSHPTGGTHLAVGKRASGYNTTAPLLPFLFAGVPGYSVPAGGQLTSDPLDFVTAIGDVLVIHTDCDSFAHQARTAGSFAGGTHYALAGADWQAESPSGFSASSGQYFGAKLEVHD